MTSFGQKRPAVFGTKCACSLQRKSCIVGAMFRYSTINSVVKLRYLPCYLTKKVSLGTVFCILLVERKT